MTEIISQLGAEWGLQLTQSSNEGVESYSGMGPGCGRHSSPGAHLEALGFPMQSEPGGTRQHLDGTWYVGHAASGLGCLVGSALITHT